VVTRGGGGSEADAGGWSDVRRGRVWGVWDEARGHSELKVGEKGTGWFGFWVDRAWGKEKTGSCTEWFGFWVPVHVDEPEKEE
jgi:hypothetical protein